MTQPGATFIPSLHFHRLTPLYDPLARWLLRDAELKQRLVTQVAPQPGMRVLDLGCGTGTLTLMLQRAQPFSELTGLDIDPAMLQRAQAKPTAARAPIAWVEGTTTALPYANAVFDRVTASLMVHHLTDDQKQRTLGEIVRVLRPGGEFHMLDFGPAHSIPLEAAARFIRHFEQTDAHITGRIFGMMQAAGFDDVTETGHTASMIGPLSFYRARKPAAPPADDAPADASHP